jgi:hypothetical protein
VLWPLGRIGFVLVGFESNVLEKSRPDRVGNDFFSLSLPLIGGTIGADLSRVVDIVRFTWVGTCGRPDRRGIEGFLDIPTCRGMGTCDCVLEIPNGIGGIVPWDVGGRRRVGIDFVRGIGIELSCRSCR